MPYNYPGFKLAHPFPEPRPRSTFGWHGGADYAAEAGRPVPAMYAGTVWRSGFIDGYGMAVIVRSDTAAGPIYTLYGHLGPNGMPAADAEIKPGQILGEVASKKYNETFGLQYNPHLHLEVISDGARPSRTGHMGGKSSDITHRANPETFDINDPKFPYESGGPPPRPAQKGLAAKPSDSSPVARPAPSSPLRPPPTGTDAAPAVKPSSKIGPPLDITPHLPPTGGGYAPQPSSEPTGSLYFSPQPSPRQFGPFTWPSEGNSGTDSSGIRNGAPADSSIATGSTPGQIGNDGTQNDRGGVWTTAQQYMGGQARPMQPALTPPPDAPGAFPGSGASPTGSINQINRSFDASLDRNSGNAGNAHPTGFDDGTAGQPFAPQSPVPPPTLTVQNLTTHVLGMKGVPDADIAAAINDPDRMQVLLNQLYGGRSAIAPGNDGNGFGRIISPDPMADRTDQTAMPTATPDNHPPFGWAGLTALQR